MGPGRLDSFQGMNWKQHEGTLLDASLAWPLPSMDKPSDSPGSVRREATIQALILGIAMLAILAGLAGIASLGWLLARKWLVGDS